MQTTDSTLDPSPPHGDTRQPPLLVGDLQALRTKLTGLTGRWRKRWTYFLDQARRERRSVRWYGSHGVSDTPLHAAFAYLATGEDEWRDIGRRDLLWLADQYEETLKVGAQEFDTWMYAAPMARRAIALDWLWDSGAFSTAEQDELAELFITDSLKYPYIVLHHRVPAHANNQGMAMALNIATVGYLFGVKWRQDARARHLLEVGLQHLTQQIAYLPPDGYSGEGSTYIVGVADPLTALACALLEEMSGIDVLHTELAPNRNSPAKILALGSRLIPPSGLLPAWDQHGYQLSKAGTTAAYLAHRTGDPAYYAAYQCGESWEFSGHFAWLGDDHVWQWLWMPDPSTEALSDSARGCYPDSWAETHVAGALIDTDARFHLFQMWDISTPFPVRLHMNPNAIQLEAWGSVLTVDGNATDGFPLSERKETKFLHWATDPPTTMSWAAGSLGAHSCIVIDGDIAHRAPSPGFQNLPGDAATGTLLRLNADDGLQVLAADAARQYQNGYDVRSMIRSSALVDDAFWVVVDQIQADSSHDFTWQLVLRHGAERTDYGARLKTAEHVVLDVFNVDGAPHELIDMQGYPSLLEKRCHHLQKTLSGNELEFATVLVPQLARRELADWSAGWEGAWIAANMPVEPDALGTAEWHPMALADAYYPPPNADAHARLWLRRRCSLPAATGACLLELPRCYMGGLWLDGERQHVPVLASTHGGDPLLVPPFVELTADQVARPTVDLLLCIDRPGPLTGHVKLHQSLDVPVPRVVRDGNSLRVTYGDIDSYISLDSIRTAAIDLPPPAPDGLDPAALAQQLRERILPRWESDVGDWQGDAAARGRACAQAITAPADSDLTELLSCLDDDDWTVRILAIQALGLSGAAAAVEPLRRALHEETAERVANVDYAPRYRIKEMCILALHRIGDPRVAPVLCACMAEAEFYGVRRLAAEALSDLGDTDCLPVLEGWTADSDTETAMAARRAIAAITARS